MRKKRSPISLKDSRARSSRACAANSRPSRNRAARSETAGRNHRRTKKLESAKADAIAPAIRKPQDAPRRKHELQTVRPHLE